MKKKIFTTLPSLLLILPNSMSYFANIITNQFGTVQNQLANIPNNINDKESYDIGDGNPVTPYLRYGNANNNFWIYQTSIRRNIFLYKCIKFAQVPDAWASWGNTSYKGKPYIINNISKYLSETEPNYIDNKRMVNSYDVNENSLDWLRVKEHYGTAVVEILVRFHFTWYYNSASKEFYFQIGIYMYGETWASLSGGGIWADLGKKLIFYN